MAAIFVAALTVCSRPAEACDAQESVEQCYSPSAEKFCRSFGEARCAVVDCDDSVAVGQELLERCIQVKSRLNVAKGMLANLTGTEEGRWYLDEISKYEQTVDALIRKYSVSLQAANQHGGIKLAIGASQVCVGSQCADRDGDLVPDSVDACPDVRGAPSENPKLNGCPRGLVRVSEDKLSFDHLRVYFAVDKAILLPSSLPALQEATEALKAAPQIEKVSIDVHTDNVGDAAKNRKLSEQRANSIKKWMVQHGIQDSRIETHGFGGERPIHENRTAVGRASNRRVELRVVAVASAPTIAKERQSVPDAKPNVHHEAPVLPDLGMPDIREVGHSKKLGPAGPPWIHGR